MRHGLRWRAASAALCAPVVFGVSLALPPNLGAGDALACSGGAAPATTEPPGFTWAKPTQVDISSRNGVSIATDGFFTIDVEGNDVSAEQALAALVVRVEDAQGNEVEGEVELLKEHRAGWYIFAWTADAPLALGAQLTARIGAEPAAQDPVGGTYVLVVDGEPTPLDGQSLSLKYWSNVYSPTGPLVTCQFESTCGPSMGDVPSGIIEATGATPIWSRPPRVGGVAWEARLEISSRSPDAVIADERRLYLSTLNDVEIGFSTVVFPRESDAYCVDLVVEDLRTHQETRSGVCAVADRQREVEVHSEITKCNAPPSEATTKAWCLSHEESTLPACVALRADDPVAGTGGTSGTPTAPDDEAGAESAGLRTSKGCQLGGSSATCPLPFFAGLALLLSERLLRRWASRSRWTPERAVASPSAPRSSRR